MSLCTHFVSLYSMREMLRDPAHGLAVAYTTADSGELSCHYFAPTEDKLAYTRRGLALGKPGRFDTCQRRRWPASVRPA